MHLSSLLTAEHIVADMKADDHWPAIVELVDHLDRHDLLFPEDRESVLEALKHREEFMSTGVGSGIAIPHAYSDRTDRILAAFGRSPGGINFDSLDSNPVHFVVLFMVPRSDHTLHLQTLAAIARMFSDPEIKSDLAAATSAEDLYEAISRRPARSPGC
jgi:mannitol/fructose-specific phosphotransferase system IIA component (Ntr-type)